MNSSEKEIARLRREAVRTGDKQMEVACDLHQSRLDELKDGTHIWMNDRPFEHRGHWGTVLTADRCDFAGGVSVSKPKGITEKHLIQDMMEIAAWHAVHIHPHLNGFQGYDAFEITLVAH
jgi:hypothetical protein